MNKDMTIEVLQDVYERSNNGSMSSAQAAYWLPIVCAYALQLLIICKKAQIFEIRDCTMRLIMLYYKGNTPGSTNGYHES